MVFKTVRNSLSGSVATWAFSGRAHHVTEHHPAYIPYHLDTPAAYAPAGNTIPYTLTRDDGMLKFIA